MRIAPTIYIDVADRSFGRVGEYFSDDDVSCGEGWNQEQRQQGEGASI